MAVWKRYVALCAILLGLGACNTVGGFGEDMEAAGDAMEDSAEENKNY